MIDYTRKRKNMGPDGAGFHPSYRIIQPRRDTVKERTAKVIRSAVAATSENIVFIVISIVAIIIIARLAFV